MIVPKKNRIAIYNQLFKDGVIVAAKDHFGVTSLGDPKDETREKVPTLHIIKLCQSLDSRGLVRTTFSWQHYYYFLEDAGVAYLQSYLGIPSEVIPTTHQKPPRTAGRLPGGPGGPGGPRGGPGGDRGGPRRFGGAPGGKPGGPGGDFKPSFGGQEGYRADEGGAAAPFGGRAQ